MKTFITDDFILQTKTAKILYHDYAKSMPIIDYHCHLNPSEIANNKTYRSITEMWLDADHYKWRAIRSAGFKEDDITGNIGNSIYDKERFMQFAKTIPMAIGNPLYHWTHLELLRYFDIDKIFNEKNADEIYVDANNVIADPSFNAQNIIKKFNVKFIGTTDDPVDNLEHHLAIKNQKLDCVVAPSWRPDKIIKINLAGFTDYIDKLSTVSNIKIIDIDSLLSAIFVRLDFFTANGCSISDHGFDEFVFTKNFTKDEANKSFIKALSGNTLTDNEILQYKSFIMVELGKKYSQLNYVMQLHISVLRNNNTRLFNKLGADVGFDSINDKTYAKDLSAYLDILDASNSLPKTILYSLNPSDNEILGTMIGNFASSGIKGKIQFGSAWWFNDHKDGMEHQLIALANLGLLANFVGMLTDSRSFLSYSRHEYFRRILCNLIGKWAENGEVPNDIEYLGKMVQDICYNNAKEYFNIKLPSGT